MDYQGKFECLGFAVYCDNCGRKHHFPAAESLEQAIEDARAKGLVVVGNAQFCNDECRREDAGEICQHVYSRSDPSVCVKCGDTRDL